MISAVLFDMNEVLCRYDREARIACLARVCAKAPSFVEAAIWGSGYEDLADSGAMDAEAYLSGFGERLGCALTRKQWIAALRAAVTPISEALALAARIARETRVAVLTNNNLLVAREIDRVFPELRPIFDKRFFVSAEFGARKPDPEAYRRCLARLGAAPAATLFVDDSAKNVAGAERAGLHGHVYTSVEALAEALRREGLLRAGG
ncbi:MAG: HAD family phosphatase [Roseiarcus sp.]